MHEFAPVDVPEPSLQFAMYGRSPRLHLNADAQAILRGWFKSTAPLRISIIRSKAEPRLIAVGLDDYGVQLAEGYASAARFTKKLGVQLPFAVTLTPHASQELLVGQLPLTEIPRMAPLQLPAEPVDQTSLRGIIRAVSVSDLPAEEVVHEDTPYEDDEESDDEYDDAED
jgi:hypothetical protein